MRQISRDSFARLDAIRQNVWVNSHKTCDNCGQVRLTKTGKRYLYQYGVWYDGGRKDWGTRLFCSKQCRDDYHR